MDTCKITTCKHPLPTDGDTETLNHELEAELAEDDAREHKFTTISLWQVFLYHRRVPTHDEKVNIYDV
jgi:hypothetical protein